MLRCKILFACKIYVQGFPLAVYTWGGTSAGGQSVNWGGLMRGDIDLMGGGGLTLTDNIIN